MYADGVTELPEQPDQAWAVAADVRRFMQHNVDAIGAPGEQQPAHQLAALRRIETATDRAIENAYRTFGIADELVKRRTVRGEPFEPVLAWHTIGRDDEHVHLYLWRVACQSCRIRQRIA